MLYQKTSTIVNGLYEPNDEEYKWPSHDEFSLLDDIKEKINIVDKDSKDT